MSIPKDELYKAQIERTLSELYHRMDNVLLDWLPRHERGRKEETFTNQQRESVKAVQAIESEWIIDPELRQEISLLQWQEDD